MKIVSNPLMRLVAAAAMFASVLPAVAIAADKTTAAPEPREPATLDEGAGSARPRPAAPLAGPAASDKELDEIAAFMRQFAPARWAAMEGLPDGGPVRRGVMVYVVARWRHLQMLREDDPKLYEIKVQQLTAEDAIYALLARTRSPAEREPLRKELRTKVAELLKLSLTERQHRLDRLRQSLKTEEDRLHQDEGAVDSLVDERVNAFITDGPANLRSELPRRPRRAPAAPTPDVGETPDLPPHK